MDYTWKNETDKFLSAITDYALHNLGYGSTRESLSLYTTKEAFISSWNSMGSADIIVINTHGSPQVIGDGEHEYARFRYSDLYRLQSKTCRLLVLLGCNNGHYDYRFSNMAYGFVLKTNGIVVASDGTVDTSMGGFASINDKYYRDYLIEDKSRYNRGWVVYKRVGLGTTISYTGWLSYLNPLTATKLMQYLNGNNLFR